MEEKQNMPRDQYGVLANQPGTTPYSSPAWTNYQPATSPHSNDQMYPQNSINQMYAPPPAYSVATSDQFQTG